MTESRLKVLVKLNDLIIGGCQLNALDFAICARSHGVDTTLVGYSETMYNDGPSMLDVAAERGVEIEVLDAGQREGWRNRRRRARDFNALADRLDVDLVHTYGAWTARQAYWGPCKLAKRPFVQTVYEMYMPRTVYRHMPLIVGTRYLLHELESTRGNVDLISPPVDLARDAPGVVSEEPPNAALIGSAPNGETRVVVVSRLDEDMKAHGIAIAISAIEQMARDDVVLVIVGTGDAEPRLRAQAESVNDNLGREAVVFAGPMGDPRSAYDAADITLGMGGSAARSLAFATPLVVVGERGWSQRFTPETSDYLFSQSFWSNEVVADERAVRMLIDELQPILDSTSERDGLGRFARTFAEQNFGLEKMTERMVSVYNRAMATYDRRAWLADWRTEIENTIGWVTWRLPWRKQS